MTLIHCAPLTTLLSARHKLMTLSINVLMLLSESTSLSQQSDWHDAMVIKMKGQT
jgi:hypothetical protein